MQALRITVLVVSRYKDSSHACNTECFNDADQRLVHWSCTGTAAAPWHRLLYVCSAACLCSTPRIGLQEQ